MYPRLFEIPAIFGIGPLTIYTYGVMLAAAYLAGLQLAIVRGRKAGLDPGRLLDLGVYIVIAALIGAKLLLLRRQFRTTSATTLTRFSCLRAPAACFTVA